MPEGPIAPEVVQPKTNILNRFKARFFRLSQAQVFAAQQEVKSEPALKPLRLPAEINRVWISPDGTETTVGAFSTHASISKKMGAVGDDFDRVGDMLSKGYVRKAYLGEYSIGIVNPRVLSIIDEAAKRDARYMLAQRGQSGKDLYIHLDIPGRSVNLSLYADQRAVQLKALLDESLVDAIPAS